MSLIELSLFDAVPLCEIIPSTSMVIKSKEWTILKDVEDVLCPAGSNIQQILNSLCKNEQLPQIH